MTAGRCGLCGNKFGQRAEDIVHADCVDEMNKKYDRLRERLDQFEAYGMPNVAAALDRVNAAESRLAAALDALWDAERFVTYYMSMPLGKRIADRKRLLAALRAFLAGGG